MTGAAHTEIAELTRPQAAESLEISKVVSLLKAEFLTPTQVASLLKVSRWTLATWRLKQQGPPFMLMSRGVVVYPAERFKSYLRALPQKGCRERAGARYRAN